MTELVTELRVSAMANVVMAGNGWGLFLLFVDRSTCSWVGSWAGSHNGL